MRPSVLILVLCGCGGGMTSAGSTGGLPTGSGGGGAGGTAGGGAGGAGGTAGGVASCPAPGQQIQYGEIEVSGPISEFDIMGTSSYPSRFIKSGPPGLGSYVWYANARGAIVSVGTNLFGGPSMTTQQFAGGTTAGGFAFDSSGKLWAASNVSGTANAIVLIDTVAGTMVASYPVPVPTSQLGDVAPGSGGMWFTESLAGGAGVSLGAITSAGSISEFPVSTVAGSTIQSATLVLGPDGNMWFDSSDNTTDCVKSMTPTGTITTFATSARSMTIGPDGNLWFVDANDSDGTTRMIGYMAIPSGNPTLFPSGLAPSDATINTLVAGADGNLWFGYGKTSSLAGVGRITLTGIVTLYPMNTTCSSTGPGGMTSGPDGNIWFVETGQTARIGRVNLGAL